MSLLSKFKNDPLLSKVLRSSGALFSTNTISLGLSVMQGSLAARLLGLEGFGLLGVVMVYAATVNSIFSFRMSELVVRYGGEYLGKGEKDKASAIMKAAGLSEAVVSLLAFLVVALTAGLAERYLTETPGTAWMFTVFAIGLLANFNTETSTGILQVTNKIKLQGTINLVQSIVTAIIIVDCISVKWDFADRSWRVSAWQDHSWAWYVHCRAASIASGSWPRMVESTASNARIFHVK